MENFVDEFEDNYDPIPSPNPAVKPFYPHLAFKTWEC